MDLAIVKAFCDLLLRMKVVGQSFHDGILKPIILVYFKAIKEVCSHYEIHKEVHEITFELELRIA